MESKSHSNVTMQTIRDVFSSILHVLGNLITIVLDFMKGITSLDGLQSTSNIDKPGKELKDIPGPIQLPIFGTLLTSQEMSMTDLLEANERRMKKYGPVIKEAHYWGFPIVFLLDLDHVEQVHKLPSVTRPGVEIIAHYRRMRPDRYDSVGLTNSVGNDWEKLHSIVSPIIGNRTLRMQLLDEICRMSQDVVDRIAYLGEQGNGMTIISNWIAESIFLNVFGRRMGFIDDTASGAAKRLFDNHHVNYIASHTSAYFLPIWKYLPTPVWNIYTKGEDVMIDSTEELMKQHLQEGSTELGLVDSILNTKLSWNDKRLALLETMLGSTSTVESQMIFFLYQLARHPRVEQKLYEELRTVLPSPDDPIDASTLKNLPYLKACLLETLRYSPIAPCIARVHDYPVEVGGYTIPPFSLILAQHWYASLQDSAFYKAKEFLPERWLYTNDTPPFSPHRKNLVCGFGYGRRTCPGQKLAQLNISILTAKIVRNFKIVFDEDLKKCFEWIMQPSQPLKFHFEPRPDL